MADAFPVLLSQQAAAPTLSFKYRFTLLAHLSLPWLLNSMEITKWGFISISTTAFDQLSHLREERKSRRRRPHGYCSLLLLAVVSSLPVSDVGMSKTSRDLSVFKMNTQIHFSCVPWFRKEQILHFQIPHLCPYQILPGLNVHVTLFTRKSKWLPDIWPCHANIFPPVMCVCQSVHELAWRDQFWQRKSLHCPSSHSLPLLISVTNSRLPKRNKHNFSRQNLQFDLNPFLLAKSQSDDKEVRKPWFLPMQFS